MEPPAAFSALAKRLGTSSISPWTSLMLLPLEVSFCAEPPAVLRVTARRVKSGLLARLSITLPPCLPVAPVTRMALDIVDRGSGCCAWL
jgi:hypothetical protein